MNALRIKFKFHSDKALLIQSTMDKSYWLASKTDEQVQFDRNALVIFKNVTNEPIKVEIKATHVDRVNAGILFRSNRRAHFMLGITDSIIIKMMPGEVLQIRGEDARDQRECNPVAGLTSV